MRLSSYFSYGQFCEVLCEMFPELTTSKGGWGIASNDPKNILLLFVDRDAEIVRIRNGVSTIPYRPYHTMYGCSIRMLKL